MVFWLELNNALGHGLMGKLEILDAYATNSFSSHGWRISGVQRMMKKQDLFAILRVWTH